MWISRFTKTIHWNSEWKTFKIKPHYTERHTNQSEPITTQTHYSKWSAELSLAAVVANGTMSLMVRRCHRNREKRAETWQQTFSDQLWFSRDDADVVMEVSKAFPLFQSVQHLYSTVNIHRNLPSQTQYFYPSYSCRGKIIYNNLVYIKTHYILYQVKNWLLFLFNHKLLH